MACQGLISITMGSMASNITNFSDFCGNLVLVIQAAEIALVVLKTAY